MEPIVLKHPSNTEYSVTLTPIPTPWNGFWNMRVTRRDHDIIVHRGTETCPSEEAAQRWMDRTLRMYQDIGYVLISEV